MNRITSVTGALIVLVLALTGCAAMPNAVASSGGYAPYVQPGEEGSLALRDDFESSAQETHDYWSDPSLFADAEGVQYTSPDNGISGGTGDPATGAYVPPTVPAPAAESPNGYGDVPNGEVFDRNGLAGAALGRLYIQFGEDQMGVCSASVVNSQSRSIVVTAAHCLVDFANNNAVAQSVLFIPADRSNGQEQPHGQWAATQYYIPQYFTDNAQVDDSGAVMGSGWTMDHAFLVMEEKGGQRIQDATGGMGIAFGVPVQNLVQVGYPTAEPYTGEDEYFCASTKWEQGWAAGYQHLCDMTPGSSGGAWMAYYDNQLGAGYIVAVNSTGNATKAEGSILGQGAFDLYQQADEEAA
ncbi:MAG: trypsin-like serine peptidase [Pseudoclavibacter sp.]